MHCRSNCGGMLAPTRMFKRVLTQHKTDPSKKTWITLDGSNPDYPIVEEDLCSKCIAASGVQYFDNEYFVNVEDEQEEYLDIYDLGLDIPDLENDIY